MSVFREPLDLITEQPLLKISQEGKDIIYSGLIFVNAYTYNIKVRESRYNNRSQFEFLDFKNSFEKFSDILKDIQCISAANISCYMKNLVKLIETHYPPLKNNTHIYRKVLSEFQEFSKFYINLRFDIAHDLSAIKVYFSDQANREHYVEFGVHFDERSDIFYFKTHDVPLNTSVLLRSSSNLKELYNIFLRYIEDLQPFFEFMDMVDGHCVVIDPQQVSKRCTYRRVLLEKNFSVIITVDPFNINSCPNFAFVGPNNLINEYQRRVQKNINNWDCKGYIFEQVLLVLGIERFSKELSNFISENQNDDILKADKDCSICFLSGEDDLPDITCDNQSCGSLYHKQCLYEWLSSIESRRHFNEIEGFCPNCEKSISCPIVDMYKL